VICSFIISKFSCSSSCWQILLSIKLNLSIKQPWLRLACSFIFWLQFQCCLKMELFSCGCSYLQKIKQEIIDKPHHIHGSILTLTFFKKKEVHTTFHTMQSVYANEIKKWYTTDNFRKIKFQIKFFFKPNQISLDIKEVLINKANISNFEWTRTEIYKLITYLWNPFRIFIYPKPRFCLYSETSFRRVSIIGPTYPNSYCRSHVNSPLL